MDATTLSTVTTTEMPLHVPVTDLPAHGSLERHVLSDTTNKSGDLSDLAKAGAVPTQQT